MRRRFKFLSPRRLVRVVGVAVAVLACLVIVSPASAFFPCHKPKPKFDDPTNEDPKDPPKDPPRDDPPADQPPGDTIPELNPGSMAGALGVLLSGALMLTDRRRRK